MSAREKYTVVIGLEVHAQLLTASKAYSTDSTEFGNLPNTNISVITLAHPGTLPRSNRKVVEYAIKMGLACHSAITRYNFYDRKNYFYPDLPKGYQITQDKTPICVGGHVPIKLKDGSTKNVQLTRIHMEEDAGKSMHLAGEIESLIDLNRAGVPLIEIVSEPEICNSDEAYAYLNEVRKLVRYLEICDGNMEEGSLRCDANISIMPVGTTKFGNKVEVKNMNSFRNVQRAIEHEIDRQIVLAEAGQTIVSETRMFDATTGETYSLRSKENLNDYRYFPEPDLQPIVVSDQWLADIKALMPSLPAELFEKFTAQFGLSEYDANVLTDSKEIALYFDEVCRHTSSYKMASNWVTGAVKSYLNERTLHINDFPISAARLADLIALIESGKVSHTVGAQKIFPAMLENSDAPLAIAEKLNVLQEGDADSLTPIIAEIIAKYPQKVAEYKGGKKGILGMFMGDLMKATKGKADPKVANKLMEEALNNA
ncbi:aspartyl-tRNA(Asn)/glutamyl-tRNA(Gln) amidotransferase subunit B [Flexibacter flexilis DSM 6793]|uniref:Aspartyl/glutamyl-tRNA(Asn/Gln) amidotransferase subunit B n=1 Tax=Flexibacter flexilis DSM 6793 TaxID=927664 RepID=A0A1I1MVQ2_9BACT|nr:Asp-tRNA(Asn)/Glu-tRNA(Gln) amidotransferase subunit GatB [Flexibacter flexilis]SFC88962.1 aspartyl-tRNA(Asn)/glutamyl-tRNA(Gln) amidotransferase subunit B [Flexibacter flexilis DSM 6793]